MHISSYKPNNLKRYLWIFGFVYLCILFAYDFCFLHVCAYFYWLEPCSCGIVGYWRSCSCRGWGWIISPGQQQLSNVLSDKTLLLEWMQREAMDRPAGQELKASVSARPWSQAGASLAARPEFRLTCVDKCVYWQWTVDMKLLLWSGTGMEMERPEGGLCIDLQNWNDVKSAFICICMLKLQ